MKPSHRRWLTGCLVVGLFAAVVGTRAVTEPKNDFRFSIMGDRTGGATPEIYGRVWREIDLLHPDFVINVGDTIQGGKDELADAQWQELRPVWQRYEHYPLYFTPGNHDIWNDLSRELYQKQTGRPSYYSFNYQDAHFTVLDNARGLELSEEQIQFLEADLKANPDRRPKFIFFHKPYWIALLKLGAGEFPLHQVAKKYGVEHIISGHGHQFVRMMRDGIVYMEVGSSGGSIQRGLREGKGFAEGFFYHHVWGRVKGSKVELTIKELDGPVGKGRSFRADEWDENGPKFPVEDPAQVERPGT
ncbi:MAG: metallophosphoesterase family protein [Bryobacteraceae bacterium]